jgi:antitoxin ParD1/3/4
MIQPAEKLTDIEREEAARRREEKLEALRREIQKGIDSGPARPFDVQEILAEARRRFDARR